MISETVTVAFILLVMWCAYEFIAGELSARMIRKWARIRRAAEVRQHFAYARYELMSLVMAGKIDPDSITFLSFYGLQTHAMRNPDRYDELCQEFLSGLGTSGAHNGLQGEAAGWTPEVRNVAVKTALGLGYLIYSYSRVVRAVIWLEQRFRLISFLGWCAIITRRIWNTLLTRNPTLAGMDSARTELRRLTGDDQDGNGFAHAT